MSYRATDSLTTVIISHSTWKTKSALDLLHIFSLDNIGYDLDKITVTKMITLNNFYCYIELKFIKLFL